MNIKWLLLLFCVHVVSIRAVIVSGSRWHINGKTLILLGDHHRRTLHDKKQIALIENFLKQKDIQCFFEGLPVKKTNFFDVYKKTIFPGHTLSKNNVDLGSLGDSYYQELAEIEKEQTVVLNKIANYSQELIQSDNLMDAFAQDFRDLNQAYNLNSLLSFFDKKYSLRYLTRHGYLKRRVIDIRLPFDLLAGEVSAKKLDVTILKRYLKNLFNQKQREYKALLEKFKSKDFIHKSHLYYKLYKCYAKEYKTVSNTISLCISSVDTITSNIDYYFASQIKKLFNFDALVYILNAIFFEKNKTVIAILGADHTCWIEQLLRIAKLRPQEECLLANNGNYQSSVWDRIAAGIKKKNLDIKLIPAFVKDVKEKLHHDPEHTYYDNDINIESVPLKLEQLRNILTTHKK